MLYLCTRKTETECSAVGSALRSGRRGRAFESPHSDTVKDKPLKFSGLFLFFSKSAGTKSGREFLAQFENLGELVKIPIFVG